MKTLTGWHNSGVRTLEEYLQVGDEVDLEMVDHFINLLPPRTLNATLVQVGEPYSMAPGDDGKNHTTWTTFHKANGKWYYAGNCFVGESINRTEEEWFK